MEKEAVVRVHQTLVMFLLAVCCERMECIAWMERRSKTYCLSLTPAQTVFSFHIEPQGYFIIMLVVIVEAIPPLVAVLHLFEQTRQLLIQHHQALLLDQPILNRIQFTLLISLEDGVKLYCRLDWN